MRLASLAGPARVLGAVCARPFERVARAKGWRWCALVAAECLVAAACGAVLWWSTSLWGLPDVGDPFDVAAFKAQRVAPGDNAYVLFAPAVAMYEPPEKGDQPVRTPRKPGGPNPNDPQIAAQLEANRAALDLFYQGCDRPDAMRPRPGPRSQGQVDGWAVRELVRLALEDATRRQARGDAAGAWRCYRAVFRASRLVARHGTIVDRVAGGHYRDMANRLLIGWVEDPATTPALLRAALDDLVALEALAADDAYTVKAEYLEAMRPDNQEAVAREVASRMAPWQVGDLQVPQEWMRTVYHARRFLAREPERSDRVTRLMAAQWLAYFATPPARRPKPAMRLVMRLSPRQVLRCDLFPPGPGAPAAARALAPDALGRWALSTSDGREGVFWRWADFTTFRDQELRGQHRLVYLVAEALYRRERGGPPPTDEALVGTYLDRLPDVPDAADDATIPALEATADPS
jgi:hypothetical protein